MKRVIWGIPSTLTNTTLVTPTITGGTVTGADITVGAGKTLDVSAGTLTLADDQIATGKIGAGALPSDVTVNNDNWSGTDLAVTNGGTGASTAADAFTALKQAATESATGVAELATVTEAITGTDTSRITTPAGVAGAMAVQTNPLAKSQGVHMTYVLGGTTGITVADNDNIDFGTGDFTLVWRGALPDWTPSATVRLLDKHDITNGYRPQITTEGKLRLLVNDGSDIDITSTSALGFVDGTEHELAIVVTRNSSVAMYADGKLIHTASITESPIVTVNNAVPLYISGYSTARFESDNKSVYTYNRALSASEVLDLYLNGPDFADKWGSQTAVYTSNFSAGSDSWATGYGTVTGNKDGINGVDDCMEFKGDDSVHPHYMARTFDAGGLAAGKYYFTFDYYIPSAQANINGMGMYNNTPTLIVPCTSLNTTGSWVTYSGVYTASESFTGFKFYAFKNSENNVDMDSTEYIYIKNFSIKRLGATLALEPEGIQQGRWLDSSSNALNATWPTSGASLIRPISNQPVLTNLLTNSGFGVWSNGTLENVGSDKVTNGGFTSDTYWSKEHATITIADSVAHFASVPTQNRLYGVISDYEIGKLYKVTFDNSNYSAGGITVSLCSGAPVSSTFSSNGTHNYVFEATVVNNYIGFRAEGTTTLDIDNVTLYEVTPGCVGADTKAMDGWYKSSTGSGYPKIYREHSGSNVPKGTFYGVKVVPQTGNTVAELYYPSSGVGSKPEFLSRFAGRTVTFGIKVICGTIGKCRIGIKDGVGTTYSEYNTKATEDWLEVTRSVSSSASYFYIFIQTLEGYTAYYSQPMLVYGSSIGEGNYQPISQETIWLDSRIRVESGAVSASKSVNTEVWTQGKLPKGIKAAHFTMQVVNSGTIGKQAQIADKLIDSTSWLGVCSLGAGITNSGSGWVKADANGDFGVYTQDENFSLCIDLMGVQVN